MSENYEEIDNTIVNYTHNELAKPVIGVHLCNGNGRVTKIAAYAGPYTPGYKINTGNGTYKYRRLLSMGAIFESPRNETPQEELFENDE
ncbi:hypothetical protein BBP40_011570 [Aspergillus hancockii]|nr:hypothetical protein BBP40_011570 [Aspergillus hancockii]